MSDKINAYVVETHPHTVEKSKVVERCMCCGLPEQHKDFEARRTHDFNDSLCEDCKEYHKKKSTRVIFVCLLGLALTIACATAAVIIINSIVHIEDAFMVVLWYLGFHAVCGIPIMLLLGFIIKIPKTDMDDKCISPVAIIEKKLSKEAGAKSEGNIAYMFSNEEYAKDFAKNCKAEVRTIPDAITIPKKNLFSSTHGFISLVFGVAFPLITVVVLFWNSIH